MTKLLTWALLLAGPSPDAPPKREARTWAESELPPATSHEIEIEIREREAAIEADRRRAIGLLEEFIEKHGDSRGMPEALYRLAALYWERSQQRFLSDMKQWALAVDRCKQDPGTCPKGPPPEPQLDLRPSQAIYERLIAEYPRFRKIDTVHYLLGFSLRDQGQAERAQQHFWTIIRHHPRSNFHADAWLAVGDHRFYHEVDFDSALQAYQKVLEHPESASYAMALFKTAWCHWKLGNRDRAILRFKEVLDQAASPEQDAAGRQRLADLRDEALEYLVQVLSEDETQTPKEIYDFLASIGGKKYSRKVLVRLGQAYEAQTRYDKSVPTYRFLIGLDAGHPDNAEYQTHVFKGIRGRGDATKALRALTTLHEQYGPDTDWGRAHPAQARSAHDRGAKLLYDFARSIHENAQAHEKATKVPDEDRYALAAKAYEDYILRFPASEHAVELSYLIGDIYSFKLDRPEPAGDAYLRVGESAPVGALHRDALLAAIAAYERVLAEQPDRRAQTSSEPEDTAPADGPAAGDQPASDDAESNEHTEPDDEERDQPGDARDDEEHTDRESAGSPRHGPVERKFIRATNLFAALFPEDEAIGTVLYKLGDFFYARGDYDAAVQRYGEIVLDHPASENAGAAGDRILESLKRAQEYDNIELWAQKLKNAEAFSEAAEQNRLDRIIVDSLLKQGETLADRGYYARAGNYYLRVAKEYPKHAKAPMALNNAGAALERAGRADAATGVYETLAEQYPSTKQGAEAALIVARVNENIARYEAAAKHYDNLVKRHARHPDRADALYNAGILYQALGQHESAIARFRAYSRQYADREDAIDVELRIGQVHAEAGRHGAATKAFAAFERRHPRDPRAVEALTRRGEALMELGRPKRAKRALAAAVERARKLEGEARIFGARARFDQGELIHRQFRQTELDPRPARLGDSLEHKAKLLAAAKQAYLDVLSFGSAEWSTAALYRIGESYQEFAVSLREYPVPENLSAEQEQAYVEQLDTYALMFEEQAIEAYKSGYAKAMDLGIYNRHTRKIRVALGRLSKQQFPPIAEIGTEPMAAEAGVSAGRPVRRLQR